MGWQERFRQECAFEAEGGAAALLGKTRKDCPYDEATQPTAWNFWVYGCENAHGELQTLERGEVFFSDSGPVSEDFMKPGTGTPLRQAFEAGWWKPKYVSVPDEWKRP